jgi:hypothetical protein
MPAPLAVVAFVILASALIQYAGLPRAAVAQDPGDVDCNGRVDSIDAALVLQLDARRGSSLPCGAEADVNQDRLTNSLDALFILQFTAGLIGAFPRCDASADPGNAQQTIDGAGSGTTLCLQPGTYRGIFVFNKTDLRIVGAGMSSTVVNEVPGSDWCVFVGESESIEISDLRAQSCDGQAVFANESTGIVIRRVETTGGPIGFQYQGSSGRIEDSRAHDHASFGVLAQVRSDVTVDNIRVQRTDIGVLAQEYTTLRLRDSTISDNNGGVFTLQQTGHTVIDGTRVAGNELNVFAGVPGCADLPPADPNPPQCFLDDPDRFRSDIVIEVDRSTMSGSEGPNVVFFPGVRATLTNSTVRDGGLTGLFAWGARLAAAGNEYDGNVENAIECRAYPGPSTGDRGMCELTFEHIRNSLPLSGNRLGGGFVSEGGEFRLTRSLIENNWGIGVQVLHGGKGIVSDTTIRNNGGSAFCVSGETWITVERNIESGNRPGACLGHP